MGVHHRRGGGRQRQPQADPQPEGRADDEAQRRLGSVTPRWMKMSPVTNQSTTTQNTSAARRRRTPLDCPARNRTAGSGRGGQHVPGGDQQGENQDLEEAQAHVRRPSDSHRPLRTSAFMTDQISRWRSRKAGVMRISETSRGGEVDLKSPIGWVAGPADRHHDAIRQRDRLPRGRA